MSTTQELIEQLRKGTAGLTLYEIEALWGEAATALSATEKERNLTGARFFIDHGQIHDRVTGKHVTTDEDSVFCDGINSALELLNGLDASVRAAAALIVALVNSAPTDTAKLADEIEALAKDATPGPWDVMKNGFGRRSNYPTVYHAGDELNYVCKCADFATKSPTRNEENAALIVAFVNSAPTIIAALRELEAVKVREAKLREFVKTVSLCPDPRERPEDDIDGLYDDCNRFSLLIDDARAALGSEG